MAHYLIFSPTNLMVLTNLKYRSNLLLTDHGIKCYHCDGLADPKTCNETTVCAAGEVQYVTFKKKKTFYSLMSKNHLSLFERRLSFDFPRYQLNKLVF